MAPTLPNDNRIHLALPETIHFAPLPVTSLLGYHTYAQMPNPKQEEDWGLMPNPQYLYETEGRGLATLNVVLLQAVRERLAAEFAHFDMASWVEPVQWWGVRGKEAMDYSRGACGTTACIGGWAAHLLVPTPLRPDASAEHQAQMEKWNAEARALLPTNFSVSGRVAGQAESFTRAALTHTRAGVSTRGFFHLMTHGLLLLPYQGKTLSYLERNALGTLFHTDSWPRAFRDAHLATNKAITWLVDQRVDYSNPTEVEVRAEMALRRELARIAIDAIESFVRAWPGPKWCDAGTLLMAPHDPLDYREFIIDRPSGDDESEDESED